MARLGVGPGEAVRKPAGRLGYVFAPWGGPPPGTFDPGLEAQVRQSERGLLDLIEESRRDQTRQRKDVGQKRRETKRGLARTIADTQRARGYAVEDAQLAERSLGINFSRTLADLSAAKMRGEEDYQRVLSDVQHRYATQAQESTQGAVAAGGAERGTQAAAEAVRAANQKQDRDRLAVEHLRRIVDIGTSRIRAFQDRDTRLAAIQQGLGRELDRYGIGERRARQDTRAGLNALTRAAHRATFDRYDKLSKAKREQGIYAQDVAEQAYFQAHQNNPNILFPSSANTPPPGSGPGAGHPGIGGGRALGGPRPYSVDRRGYLRY